MALYRRILVAIDASPQSKRCLDHAIALAIDQDAVLRIVHAVDYISPPFDTTNVAEGQLHNAYIDAGNSVITSALEQARSRGLTVDAVVIDTDDPRRPAADTLLRDIEEWHADIVIVGTHGRTGLARLFLGSVSETILRSANVPVLVLRTTG